MSKLQEIKTYLYFLSQGCEEEDTEEYAYSGLCSLISERFDIYLRPTGETLALYPDYSGILCYPIKGGKKEYHIACKAHAMYKGAYGKLRKEYALFLSCNLQEEDIVEA